MKKNSTKRIGLLFTFFSLFVLSAFSQDVFYSTEFDGGLDGWTTINNSSADMPIAAGWAHVPEGTETEFTGTINSTSAANGYALFDSFGQCIDQANITPDTKQDVWFVSPVIDATDQSEVWLSFETLYAEFNSAAYVEISTDGGATFTGEIELWPNITVNQWSHGGSRQDPNLFNPHLSVVDLSAFAAGQANLVFAFRYLNDNVTVGGNTANDFRCGYGWSIDDLSLSNADPSPKHDLSLNEIFIPPSAITPESQIDTIFFGAEVENNGITDQTNVMINVDISKLGASVFSQSFPLGDMAVGEVDSLWYEGFYVPQDTGSYVLSYSVTADSTDVVPVDNTRESDFIIGFTNWSKEIATGIFALGLSGTINNQGIAIDNFNPGDYATTVRFMCQATEGNVLTDQTVTIRVEELPFGLALDDANLLTVAQTSYTFTQEDEDNNNSGNPIPFINEVVLNNESACAGVELKADHVYIVSVEYDDQIVTFWGSDSHTYNFQNEQAVINRRIDDTFSNWIGGEVPMIRLIITDDPETALAVNSDFTVDNATDPIIAFSEMGDFNCDWMWDFGDPESNSNTSFSQNPTHEYEDNGTYTVCLTVTNDFTESTSCQEVVIENGMVVSTVDLADVNKIEIAPNPVKDQLRLNVEMNEIAQTTNIRIADLSGKVLIENNYENVLNQQFTFDLQEFAAGTYLLHMTTEVGTTIQKFTVQK